MSAGFPEGFAVRPAVMADLKGVIDLCNTCSMHLLGVTQHDVDGLRLFWNTPGFNLATDTRVVHSPDGRLAGYALIWDVDEPHVQIYGFARVHPDYRGLGIGSALIAWQEKRARQTIAMAPEGSRVAINQEVVAQDEVAKGLFRRHRYTGIRHFWQMEISLDGAVTSPTWPKGISVRTFDLETDLESSLHTVRDSFRDHWGYVDAPFEVELAQWKHRITADEHFDPTLWFLAMDGKEIAGVALCRNKHAENPQMGWIDIVGVRKPWRNHGLALALLRHAFGELAARGKVKVGLDVDSGSLTGATRLYERVGMHVARQTDLYEKVLRPGIDLRKIAVDA